LDADYLFKHDYAPLLRLIADKLRLWELTLRATADLASLRVLRSQLHLTSAEARIVALSLRGLSNLEISEMLQISENTLKSHIKRILFKTEMPNLRALRRKLEELSCLTDRGLGQSAQDATSHANNVAAAKGQTT
jgi:DNA-binding CsgD family transcriptional regulator